MPEPKVPFEYFVRGALRNLVDGQNELLETVHRHGSEIRALRVDVDEIKRRRSDPPRWGLGKATDTGSHVIFPADEFDRLQREYEGRQIASFWRQLKDNGWKALVTYAISGLLGYLIATLLARR